jgi:hypothetical protein
MQIIRYIQKILFSAACLAALNSYAVQVATHPILFQGQDDVTFDKICLKALGKGLLTELHECSLKIAEYAGQKLIDGSYAEFDPKSRKIANIRFKMDFDAYENIKSVLTEKYGPAQIEKSTDAIYWYGDKERSSLIYISKSHPYSSGLNSVASKGATNLVIITKSMRSVMDEFDRNRDLKANQQRAKAVRDL